MRPEPVEFQQFLQDIKGKLKNGIEITNPGEVSRVAISAASRLNYDNKTDSESSEDRTEVRRH